MKFGHAFQQHLTNDGFPPEWVSSAISYRQLKKCIKRVQKELLGIGLDAETLGHTLEHARVTQEKRPDAGNQGACCGLVLPFIRSLQHASRGITSSKPQGHVHTVRCRAT